MPALVSVADLDEWLVDGVQQGEMARANRILSAVSSLVRSEAGRTWDGEVVPDDVQAIALDVAAETFLNPERFSSETLGDDYSYRKSSDSLMALTLTREQKSILGRYRQQQRGLWTQRTYRDSDPLDRVSVANL